MKTMNDIDRFEIIKRSELDEIKYMTSLISKGYEKGILEKGHIDSLQAQVLELLKVRAERYNGFESSSIAAENGSRV